MIGGLGAGLSLLGAGLGTYATYKARGAMDDVVLKQLKKQKEYQQIGSGIYQDSLANSTPLASQGYIDRGAEQARSLYERLGAIPLAQSSSQALSPRQEASQAQSGASYNRLIGAPNAQLQGITDYDLQRWINNLQANTALGVNSTQSQLAASAMPYKVQDAQNSQQALMGIASLLGSAGGAMGQYGASTNGFVKGYGQPSLYSNITPEQLALLS